jgi:hypothetical protein
LNTDFDAFIQTAKKSLDAYTDMIMDDLFDIRTETSLVREIKDILDELNIIQTIKRQQESVIEPFRIQMFQAPSKNKQRDFYDCTRLGNHVGELRRTAESTYAAVNAPQDFSNCSKSLKGVANLLNEMVAPRSTRLETKGSQRN